MQSHALLKGSTGLMAAMLIASQAHAAAFIVVPDLPGGSSYAEVTAVTYDGSVGLVAGNNSEGRRTYTYSQADGASPEIAYPGDWSRYNYGFDITDNGSHIVGQVSRQPGAPYTREYQGYIYNAGTGQYTLMGDLAGGAVDSSAAAISADGSVVAGRAENAQGKVAVRWTAEGGLQSLGSLGSTPDNTFLSYASGISADGNTIVGMSVRENGTSTAIRWTEADGMVDILDGAGNSALANAASADGSVIIGHASFGGGFQAFRWTEDTGAVFLNHTQSVNDSRGWGVSDDGNIIVGTTNILGGYIWQEETGAVNFQTYLGDLGVDMTGYQIYRVDGISGDGSTVFGYARDEFSNTVGFMADITGTVVPLPAAMWLFGSALAGLGWFRARWLRA